CYTPGTFRLLQQALSGWGCGNIHVLSYQVLSCQRGLQWTRSQAPCAKGWSRLQVHTGFLSQRGKGYITTVIRIHYILCLATMKSASSPVEHILATDTTSTLFFAARVWIRGGG